MKRILVTAGAVAIIAAGAAMPFTHSWAAEKEGKSLFQQHCAACHPGGGNIINPQKTLHKKDRLANNVKTTKDIVKIMRNPGPGMTKFGPETISDKQAHEIAEYIISTFK